MKRLPNKNKKKTKSIDLGLELLSSVAIPDEQYELQEIAAWCQCSTQRIQQIYLIAMRRLRILIRERGLDEEFLRHL